MKKLMIVSLLLSAQVASAEPIVLRAQANEYSLIGEGKISTNDCTVTAEGTLQGRLIKRGHKRWLVFLDREGAEEAQCEVRMMLTVPRSPTVVAVRR